MTDILCDYVKVNSIACIVDLTAMAAYRRLIDWRKVTKHTYVLHCFDTVAAGEYALTSFGGVFQQLGSMTAEELRALGMRQTPQAEGLGTCSLHRTGEPPAGYPREVWPPRQAEAVFRGAFAGRVSDGSSSDAKAAPWAFDMGTDFFGDIKKRGRRDFQKIVRAVVEICQAPVSGRNGSIKPLQGHSGRLWRYGIGGDRLVYEPDQSRRVIRLLRFRSRGVVYKGLAS